MGPYNQKKNPYNFFHLDFPWHDQTIPLLMN